MKSYHLARLEVAQEFYLPPKISRLRAVPYCPGSSPEIESNNGLLLSFLVLLSSKIFQDVLSEANLTKWLYLY